MKISVRESKLVVERLLLLTGMDRRLVPKVRDFLLASELAGGGAFQFLIDEFLAIEDLPAPRLRVVEDACGMVVVDGGGQYAAPLGPTLLNLMSVQAAQSDTAAILVRNVRNPQLLNGLVPLANRRGLVSFVVTGASVTPELVAMGAGRLTSPARVESWPAGDREPCVSKTNGNRAAQPGDSVGSCLILVAALERQHVPEREDDATLGSDLTRAIHEGIEVDEDLWWTLYHRSNDALTPTSELSRTHAGPSVDKLFVEF